MAGGVTNIEQMKKIFHMGYEKIVLNTAAVEKPELITEAAGIFGCQSIVVSVDAKKGLFGGYEVVTHGGKKKTGLDPVAFTKECENRGAGEILITAMDLDGTMRGYDLALIASVAQAVTLPVIASGGAGKVADFVAATKQAGAFGRSRRVHVCLSRASSGRSDQCSSPGRTSVRPGLRRFSVGVPAVIIA